MIILYGIPACDSVKKARRWLKDNDIKYIFHNYKKDGASLAMLEKWDKAVGWEAFFNKRGTTYRQLDSTTKANMDREQAFVIMQEAPSIIKRPILVVNEDIVIGPLLDRYEVLLCDTASTEG